MLHPTLHRLLGLVLLVSLLVTTHGLLPRVAGIVAQEPDASQAPEAAPEEGAAVADEAQPEGGAPRRDPFFGIVQSIHDPEMAVAAGSAWERLVVWWSAFQPNGPDEWREGVWPPRPDVEAQRARGVEVVGVVLHTPPWAARNGGDPAVSPPHNLELPFDDPQNYWGQFMARLAREYAGAIDTWIIWNEPEFCWTGTVAEFAQLQRVAYQAVKAGNPNATVILTGTTYWQDHEKGRTLFLERLLDQFARDAGVDPLSEGDGDGDEDGSELRVPGSGPEGDAGGGVASDGTASDGVVSEGAPDQDLAPVRPVPAAEGQGGAEGGEEAAPAPSPSTPGEGQDEGESLSAPSPGTPGEGGGEGEVVGEGPMPPPPWYHFDGVAVHQYGSPLNGYTVPVLYRRILTSYGIDVPLWFPESNVVPHDDPLKTLMRGGLRATMDEQASYMIQSVALARAAGVERYAVYKMRDEQPENDQYYGLVRNDGSARPAYYAYQVAVREMSGARDAVYFWSGSATPPTEDEITALLASTANRAQFVWPGAMNGVRMRRGDDRVTVLWNASAAPLEIGVPSSAPTATLLTKFGASLPLERGEDGAYRITLAAATNNTDARDPSLVLVGGDPVILVEPGAARLRDPYPRPIDACWGVPGALVWEAVGDQLSAVGEPAVSGQSSVVSEDAEGELGAYPAPGEGYPAPASEAQEIVPVRPPDGSRSEAGVAGETIAGEGEPGDVPAEGYAVATAAPERAWVAPTGYAVSGPWLDVFEASGGVEVLGYPRSPVVADPLSGADGGEPQCVQYFQRMMLEWHPQNPPEYRVQRRLLGALMGDAAPPAAPTAADGPEYRYFPHGEAGLGHAVSDLLDDGTRVGFKAFFDRYGGVDTFGYPMEPPTQRRGPDGVTRWTQRFQAALFEHHAEFDIDGVQPESGLPWRTWRVQLRLLGDEYLEDRRLPFVSGDPAKHVLRPPEPTPGG